MNSKFEALYRTLRSGELLQDQVEPAALGALTADQDNGILLDEFEHRVGLQEVLENVPHRDVLQS
jgi:hypothetical protein